MKRKRGCTIHNMKDKIHYVEIHHITKTDRVAMPYIVKKDVT